jgi:hypothetical protein
MSYHIGLQVLRAKIRGFQATGTTITSRISKSEKERKHRLWNEKRRLGWHARHHLVAYGLLRGVPYEDIERCAQNNQLDPQKVLDIIKEHGKGTWKPFMGGLRLDEWDIERVKTLLTLPDAPAARAPAREPSLKPTGRPSPSPQAAQERVA